MVNHVMRKNLDRNWTHSRSVHTFLVISWTRRRRVRKNTSYYFNLKTNSCWERMCLIITYMKSAGENTPIQSSSDGYGELNSTNTCSLCWPCQIKNSMKFGNFYQIIYLTWWRENGYYYIRSKNGWRCIDMSFFIEMERRFMDSNSW